MSSLSGRTVVITGGAGALGRAVAQRFAAAGAALVLMDRPGDHLDGVAAELGATAMGTNVLDADAVVTAASELGGIAGVVHCVGGFAMGPLVEAGPADFDRLFNLNVRSLFHVARAFLPSMAEAGDGFLVGIGAGPGLTRESPHMALYGASKAAATTMLRSLDGEIGSQGVRIGVLHPMGAFDTPANRAAMPDADPQTWIDPAELAEAAHYLATRGPRGRVNELAVYPPR